MNHSRASYLLGIDVGGTFTDVAILDLEAATIHVLKVSSTPEDPSEGIFTGIGEALAHTGAQPAEIGYLAHGTTVGINALLQNKGANVLLLTTAGFRDLLEIRRQKRPDLYDLFVDKPPTLIPRPQRYEVAERVDATGQVVRGLDEEALQSIIDEMAAAQPDAIAVCLLFSFLNPTHEEHLQALLRQRFPDRYITVSSAVAPEFREFERLGTTVLNACLGPVMARYLTNFAARVRRIGMPGTPYIAQSNGGILSVEQAIRLPVRTIASGPSAGVVGAVQVAEAAGHSDLLTFDMGGTSTDVCLVKGGRPLVTTNRMVAGLPVKSPMIDIHSIGAGGGSIAWVDEAGALWVGPQSAGSQPGPACYDRGGDAPTVTDANVILGRLNPQALLDGALPIARERAETALTTAIAEPLACSVAEAAEGVLTVVVAGMTRALRLISVERGEDPADFVLVAYGGAGPLHAALVAEALGCRRVLVPPNPGILCGIGLLLSAPRMDFVRSRRVRLVPENVAEIDRNLAALRQEAVAWFDAEAIPSPERLLIPYADVRYRRQNFELTIELPAQSFRQFDIQALIAAFHAEYTRQYGYAMPEQSLELINLRVTAIGRRPQPDWAVINRAVINRAAHIQRDENDTPPTPTETRAVRFAGQSIPTPIFRRATLPVGQPIMGPATIEQYDSTTVVPPGWQGVCDAVGNLALEVSTD